MHNSTMTYSLSLNEKMLLCLMAAIVPGVMLGFSVLVGFALLSFFILLFNAGFTGIRSALKPTMIHWGWIIFTALCGLSILTSLDVKNSTESFLFLGLILCFAALSHHYLRKSKKRITHLQCMMLCALIFMIILALLHMYVFVGFLRTALPFTSDYPERYNAVILKKPASGFVLALPLAIYCAVTMRSLGRLLALLLIVGIAWLIIISESRSAMAAALAVVGIMGFIGAIVQRWPIWVNLLIGAIFIAIIAAIIAYMLHIRGDWVNGALGLPGWIIDNPRQILWNEVLLLLDENMPHSLYTGYGINALEQLDRGVRPLMYTENRETTFTAINNHPHNWLLEIAVEVGVIGLISAITAILLGLKWAWDKRLAAPLEVCAFFGVTAAFCAASLFNYSIWSVWWQIDFAFMSALTAAMIANKLSEA